MTRTVSRRTRVLAALSATVVVFGVLVGCSAHPGAAAVVSYTATDGTERTVRVSEDDVQTAYAELGQSQGIDMPTVLQGLIELPVLEELIAGYGVTVTEADALEALETSNGPADYSQPTIDLARFMLLTSASNTLDEAALTELTSNMQRFYETAEADVSPRYVTGTWIIGENVLPQG